VQGCYEWVVFTKLKYRFIDFTGGWPPPIDLTNFCITVESNPRMHQNPPFSGKNSKIFWGGGTAPQTLPPRPSAPPPHYEILDPLLHSVEQLKRAIITEWWSASSSAPSVSHSAARTHWTLILNESVQFFVFNTICLFAEIWWTHFTVKFFGSPLHHVFAHQKWNVLAVLYVLQQRESTLRLLSFVMTLQN